MDIPPRAANNLKLWEQHMFKAYFTLTHALAKSGLGPLLLRLIIGWVFFYHGTQKLFGWFDGPGIENATEFFRTLEIPMPELAVYVAAWIEFVCGSLLVIGLFTRPASLLLTIVMAVAIYSVHLKNGFSMSNNGYEYQAVLGVATIAFMFAGPGRLSFDRLICFCCGNKKDSDMPCCGSPTSTHNKNDSPQDPQLPQKTTKTATATPPNPSQPRQSNTTTRKSHRLRPVFSCAPHNNFYCFI